MAAIRARQIENRGNSMNHALVIIGEVQGVLDFERGGDVVPKLESFGRRTHLSAVAHWMMALQATR
jgi:flagellin-specific chaperone FliS